MALLLIREAIWYWSETVSSDYRGYTNTVYMLLGVLGQ